MGLLVLAGLAIAQPAHADAVKRDLFILGVQIGGAETVSSMFEPFATADKPGALFLIRRNVRWSIDTADRIKISTKSLVLISVSPSLGRVLAQENLHLRLPGAL